MPDQAISPALAASLRAGHRQRLREKFLRFPESITDAELLELLLGYVYLRRDTKPQAKLLLQHFGGLREILHASREQISTVEGCGDPLNAFFRIITELQNRISQEEVKARASVSIADIAVMAMQRLSPLSDEEVWIALLDKQNRLLNFSKTASGGLDSVLLNPIRIVESMISAHAGRVVMVHNHPGGSAEPSVPDVELTERLGGTLQSLDLELADHLIVGSGRCFSMRLSRYL